MTTPAVAARLVGDFPQPIEAALLAAGICRDGHERLCVVWFPDSEARAWMARTDQATVIAMVRDEAEAQAALAAGAADAIVGTPSELRHRIGVVARLHAQFRRQLDHQLAAEHRTASELQSTRDLLSRLIDTTPCPVMAVSPTGQLLVFNHAAETMLGYEREWAQEHLRAGDVYANADDARRILSAIRASPRRLVRDVHTRLRTRMGETLEVSLNAAEVYAADGLPVATVGVFLDSRQQEELARRLTTTVRQFLQLEEQSNQLAASLADAFRLNQPLSTAMLTLELAMLHHAPDPELRTRLEAVYAQLEALGARVADLTSRSQRSFRGLHSSTGPAHSG